MIAPLPPPPRQPTWRASLSYYHTVGRLAVIMLTIATISVVWAWMLAGFDLPFEDRTLDDLAASGSLGSADAVVHAVHPTELKVRGQALVRVVYEWRLDGQPMRGEAYAEAGQFTTQQAYELEYLPQTPTINRPRGATRSASTRLSPWLLALWGVPFALTCWWLRNVYRIRSVLRDGLQASAEIATPQSKRARGFGFIAYRFTDQHGHEQTGKQTLTAAHPLWKEMREGRTTVPVVYDGDRGRPHRIAIASDFA